MSETCDFAWLYRQLGLRPGGSLQELRLAYRRRVARLHPDRIQGDIEALQQLNVLYGAALDFQRKMGRLPGARSGGGVAQVNRERPSSTPFQPRHEQTPPHRQSQNAYATRLRTIALLLLTLLLAAALWAAINKHLGGTPANQLDQPLGSTTVSSHGPAPIA